MLFHVLAHDYEAPAPPPRELAPGPEGFVHLCREAQLPGVRLRHFPGRAIRVHAIDEALLDASKLKDEDSYGHGLFPHYYGVVPALAIGEGTPVEQVIDEDVTRAEAIVRGFFPPTPLLHAARLSRRLGKELWIKLESATPIRAFKIRGALVKLESLRGKTRGVITASAGNHGLAVAWAARALGVPATVVMPERANPQKAEAIVGLGARTIFYGDDYQAALEHSVEIGASAELTSVHAYDDPWIVAGQGTIARELAGFETLVAGVGGGGLLAGLAVGGRARVIGVEPRGAASMGRSFEAGKVVELEKVETLADGLAARKPSAMTLRLSRRPGVELAEVTDEAILRAMRILLEEERLVAEPAGAAALAALLDAPERARGRTAIIVSGANLSDAQLAALCAGG